MDLREHERWWAERGAAELRELLYREWDPIGVRHLADDSADEYEAYAGQLMRRLRAGASDEDVALQLEGFRREMGLDPAEPPLEVARRIRAWYAESRRVSGS